MTLSYLIPTFSMHAFDFTLFDYFTQTTALCTVVMHSVGNDVACRGLPVRPIINRAAGPCRNIAREPCGCIAAPLHASAERAGPFDVALAMPLTTLYENSPPSSCTFTLSLLNVRFENHFQAYRTERSCVAVINSIS